ncbi:MAG TPA: FHA domain-containing protein [Kofleriaceae bacterium]|nr:FHA domain-containing protein [Kofleriaceae bacterium]
MTVCNRCGKENQDHYKFCLGCGAELTAPKPGGGGDMGMMKTMMADPGAGAGAPLGGPRGPSGAMPGQPMRPSGGGMPGMPPSGPLGGAPMAPPPMAPPMGPPPGVPSYGNFPPPAAAPAGGMRPCPSCGSGVPPSFRFCGTCGFRMDEQSAPAPMPQPPMGGGFAPQPQRSRLSMTLIRPDGTEGGTHDLRPGENKLGRSFGPVFENDGYLSPVHALLDIRGVQAVVRDLDSLNGVFVKMTQEEELQSGQIIRIGQELLRFEIIPTPEPTADGTELMGSPNPGFWGKLTVIIGRDVTGAAFPLLGESVTLGRERGEINFPDDGYVSGLHARISLREGRVFLADLGSSNGTFIKVNGERNVGHESFVLLGQQLFRLNFS